MVASIEYLRLNSTVPVLLLNSPFFQATKQVHQFRSDILAMAIAENHLAVVVGRELLLYDLKHFDGTQPHRCIPLSAQPEHLLLAGIDHRYIIMITAQSRYEVWDRISSTLVSHGFFPQQPGTKYQVINQQYILAYHDSVFDLYAVTDLSCPIKTQQLKGEILTCQFHPMTQKLYCVSLYRDNLRLTEICLFSTTIPEIAVLPTDPMQFVGLTVSSSMLLLQVITREGQLCVMTFDLPGLRLVSTVEKSPAYYGPTTMNPVMPWVLTDLGDGVLIWDAIAQSPIGIIESAVTQAIQCHWVDFQSFVLTDSHTIELWTLSHRPCPELACDQALTRLALDTFKTWMQNRSVGVSVLLGEDGIGKSAIVQAYIRYQPYTLYLELEPDADELSLLRGFLEVLSANFEADARLPLPEIRSVIRSYLHDVEYLVLEQCEHLSPKAMQAMLDFLDTTNLKILLVTLTIPDFVAPTYRFFPIEERLDWDAVSRFFAPAQTQWQLFSQSIQPQLAQADRHYLPALNR
jgi:hypothetical protein